MKEEETKEERCPFCNERNVIVFPESERVILDSAGRIIQRQTKVFCSECGSGWTHSVNESEEVVSNASGT